MTPSDPLQPSPRHPLLERQLEGVFGAGSSPGEPLDSLLEQISATYLDFDRDRQRLEAALGTQAQELNEANSTLRLLIDHAPAGIAMMDRQMRLLFASKRWLLDHQVPLADVVGKCVFDNGLVSERWRPVLLECMDGAERGAEDGIDLPDGQAHWVRWKVCPWRDGDGQVGGLILMYEEVTDRRVAEEQLRIAAVAFQSRDGMVVTDAGGTILQANQAFYRVTGYSPEEAIGKKPSILRSGRHEQEFYRNMWEAITREGHWEGQIWNRRKDGGIYPEWLTIAGIRDGAGNFTHYLGTFTDISDPKEAEARILELAFYDPLTGLPNRRLLLDRLHRALAAGMRNNQFGALLLLDLDHFKTLNDTRGHDVGDELLLEVARRLRATLRETDSAARLGGDEFVVLLEGLHGDPVAAANIAETIAEKVRTAIGEPVNLKGPSHRISASIGVTLFRGSDDSAEALLKQADLALYQAKDAGRDVSRFYNSTMQAAVEARVDMEAGLRRALAGQEFLLYYQPQVDAEGSLIGVEALLRWQPEGEKMISPGVFIPVAEEYGLIIPIGNWVLECACRQLAAWAGHPATRDLTMAVNVSARQFRQPDFVDQVQQALRRTGADPSRLKLELTESMILEGVERVIKSMQTLKDLGLGFSLDDFGTGYSSLAYLKRLPLDQIKIDQSFVRDIAEDADDRAIVQAVISLATSLGLQVIAEGVETEEQRAFLAAHGCQTYQGYLFGRPGPVDQLRLT